MTIRPKLNSREASKAAVLVGMILLITFLHYYTPTSKEYLHNIYQRLYYIPIILSCYWFGLAGGISSAIFLSLLYTPHVLFHWRHEEVYRFNQIVEMVLFFVIAFVAGYLSDQERKIREQYRRTAEERDRTLRELHQTFERLRLADRLSALGKLSAGMAHEIKNPLAGIYGSMEILEREFEAGHPKYEFVQILKKEIDRLTGVVHRYLELARPHSPERSLQNINAIVGSLVEISSRQAEKEGITLRTDLSREMPDTMLDEGQVRQALLNIFLNALQATPEGGSVAITTGVVGDRICVSFQDQGKGIPAADRGKLFDPFFTTKKEGTGLGLPIAFQIISQHGGDITTENAPSGGAIFTVWLPLIRKGGPA